MPFLPRLLTCAALLACDPSLAAAPKKKAGSGAPVTLRFAWPESLQAQVTESRTVFVGEATPSPSITQRYPFKVETRGEERWLVPGPVEVTPPEYAKVLGGVPTLVINPSGDLLRAEVPQATVDATLQVMVAMSDSKVTPEKEAQLREKLQQQFTAAAREKWEERVAHWRGLTLSPGRTEKHPTTLKAGTLGGEPLAAEERITVEAGVPCEPEAAEARCLRILRETRPDAKELALRVKDFEARMSEGLPKERRTHVKKVDLHVTRELVTAPDTLLPYRVRDETSDRVDITLGKEPLPGEGLRQVDEAVFTYVK